MCWAWRAVSVSPGKWFVKKLRWKYDQIFVKHFPWEIPTAWFVCLCSRPSPWCKIIALLGHRCCRKFRISCLRNFYATQDVWMSKPNQHYLMLISLVYHIPTTWVMEIDWKNDSKRTDVRNIWRTLASCQANVLYFQMHKNNNFQRSNNGKVRKEKRKILVILLLIPTGSIHGHMMKRRPIRLVTSSPIIGHNWKHDVLY